MTEVLKFKSDSGREYLTREAAMAQDRLFAEQNAVSKLLPQAVDDSCRFANGHGYIQHTQEDVAAFRHGMRRLIEMEFGGESEILKAWDNGFGSSVGRYLSESGSNTYRLWCRLSATGDDLREWGQGYYRLNPTEGTQKHWPNVARLGLRYVDK